MVEIRDAFRLRHIVNVNGVYTNETDEEFLDFDWRKDDMREYYSFDITTRIITSLGIYDCYNQGPEISSEYIRLLIKFY